MNKLFFMVLLVAIFTTSCKNKEAGSTNESSTQSIVIKSGTELSNDENQNSIPKSVVYDTEEIYGELGEQMLLVPDELSGGFINSSTAKITEVVESNGNEINYKFLSLRYFREMQTGFKSKTGNRISKSFLFTQRKNACLNSNGVIYCNGDITRSKGEEIELRGIQIVPENFSNGVPQRKVIVLVRSKNFKNTSIIFTTEQYLEIMRNAN